MARRPFLQGVELKLSTELQQFSARLGHHFSELEYLVQAVTHSSLSSPTRSDNQRLEFLGDRVLGLVMAEALLALDPTATEGQLAPRFNALVRKETCADVAREIDLGAVLKLGRSEMISGGRRKQALLGDAIEAAAIAQTLGDCPVVAHKSNFGNLGPGTSMVELIAGVMTLDQKTIPSTMNHEQTGDDCPINVVAETTPLAKGVLVKNSISATGQFASLVLRSNL